MRFVGFLFALALSVGLVFGGATSAQTGATVADPRNAVQIMMAAVAARDPVAIAALYAHDAFVMAPNRLLISGRDAIRESWAQSFASGYSLLEVGPQRTESGSDRAAMIFVWQATIQPAGGAAQRVNGRSMLYFTLRDGGWLISADMWQPIP